MKHFILSLVLMFSIKASTAQITYTFNGNGNWSDSTNWLNTQKPPETLRTGDSIIINPVEGGQCVLNVPQFISQGAVLSMPENKKLVVNENLIIKPERFRIGGVIPSSLESLMAIPVFDTAGLGSRFLQRPMLEERFSLDMPPPMRQGSVQNSCAAFAACYILRSYHLHKDECEIPYDIADDDSRVFSPSFLYNEFMHSLGDLTCGRGLSIADELLPAMYEYGTATLLEMPYNQSHCQTRPNDKQKKNASFFPVISAARIKDLDLTETFIKTLVKNKFPILIGVRTDEGFRADGTRVWSSTRGEAETVGGHTLVICGWDDAKHAYKVMNPWGGTWAPDGMGWIDYDHIYTALIKKETATEKFWEVYVIKTEPTNYDPGIKVLNTEPERYAREEVLFSDTSQPKPVSSRWYFEGGTPETSTEREPKVVWNEPGTYTVQLTINQECSVITKYKDTTIIIEEPLTFTDSRDGQVYTYKKIGTQYWMTQNLNYVADSSWCYNNNPANCAIYGRLYNWDAAMISAPSGWHLPSGQEWQLLVDYLGGRNIAGGAMKSTSSLWNDPNVGATNSSGFSGLPGGRYFSAENISNEMGSAGIWWNSDLYSEPSYRFYYYLLSSGSQTGGIITPRRIGYSVRCVKD